MTYTGAMYHRDTDTQFPDGRPYVWVVTRSRHAEVTGDDTDDLQGLTGPVRPSAAAQAGLAAGDAVPFRIYDEGDVDERWYDSEAAVGRGHPNYGLLHEGLIYVEPQAGAHWLDAPYFDYFNAALGYADIRVLDEDGKTWKSI